jgi:hypothetical protein
MLPGPRRAANALCGLAQTRIASLPHSRYESGMTTLSLSLPDKLVARLDDAAKARKKTRKAFVREVLVKSIPSTPASKAPSLLERTRNLCGVGDSGMRDLSSNPAHLNDFGA